MLKELFGNVNKILIWIYFFYKRDTISKIFVNIEITLKGKGFIFLLVSLLKIRRVDKPSRTTSKTIMLIFQEENLYAVRNLISKNTISIESRVVSKIRSLPMRLEIKREASRINVKIKESTVNTTNKIPIRRSDLVPLNEMSLLKEPDIILL